MKKSPMIMSTVGMILLGLTSCGGGESNPSAPVIDENYYDNVAQRAAFDASNTNNIKEDFVGGMSDDVWLTIDGAWHTNVVGAEHNGVKSRNLFYTSNNNKNYLAIKGRGFYNQEDPDNIGKPEGGAIISKNHLGPGRYEIKMAAMPREGGVTAMWSYCTTTGNEVTSQNEIDIEIGGTSSSSQFEKMWSTSWTKRETKETKIVDAKDICYLNDGQIHTYTFDWYTKYPGSNNRRVDWFIDGHYVESLEGNVVPEHEMPLWIGLWFPPLWAGNPSFIEDYLLIEEISYQAFNTAQYVESCRAEAPYNKQIPSQANIQTIPFSKITSVNKLANSDFESLATSGRDNSYFGWKVDSASKGTIALSNQSSQGNSSFLLTSSNDTSGKYNGEYLKQTITNAFSGYKYHFSIDAKRLDATSEGNIEIYYRDSLGAKIGQTIVLPITSDNFTSYTYDIIMPANAFALEIDLTSEKGSILYDNASLVYLGLK